MTLAERIPDARLWSPRTPHLYTARVRLLSDGQVIDTRSVRFGMREFKVDGGKFLLNGKPIFLRGYGDDCIFPDTICPPANKEELRRRLSLARGYGFNYVRHHSWIPPEDYLDAADELGMMLQPEFPFAYRWDLPSTPEAKRSALEQWEAVIRLHRNHPSIVTWCMGNEQYDSFDLAPAMYRAAKRLDPTRPVVDSDGCGFKHKDRGTLDFLVVQFGEGHSIGYQDGKYNVPAGITKPVIAHEMGYFVTLHDLAQLDLFKDGLRPYWLHQTRELAASKGLLAAYPDWLAASYRLQAVCLKTNLEAARRSRLSGTSVWLFQDYPNCAEGVVDMFLRPKALRPEEFRTFNAPTVLLLDAPRRNWWCGETLDLKFLVSRFEDEPSDSATLRWTLKSGDETLAQGVHEGLRVRADGVQELRDDRAEGPGAGEGRASHADGGTHRRQRQDPEFLESVGLPEGTTPRGDCRKVRASGFPAIRDVHPWVPDHQDGPVPPETRPPGHDTSGPRRHRLFEGGRPRHPAGARADVHGREDQLPPLVLGRRRPLRHDLRPGPPRASRHALGGLVRPPVLFADPGLEDGPPGRAAG